MAIFKRIEIWILLLLLVGGAVYVITSGSRGREGEGRIVAEEGASRIRIEKMEVVRDYGNAKLDLRIRYDNTGGAELAASPPDIRLVTGDGEPVDVFFLAGDFPPSVPAGAVAEVTLRYWLKPEHFDQSLSLEIRGQSVPVKSARPFDLGALENQETRELEGIDW